MDEKYVDGREPFDSWERYDPLKIDDYLQPLNYDELVDVMRVGDVRVNVNNGNPVELLKVPFGEDGDSFFRVKDLVLDQTYDLKRRRIGRVLDPLEVLARVSL